MERDAGGEQQELRKEPFGSSAPPVLSEVLPGAGSFGTQGAGRADDMLALPRQASNPLQKCSSVLRSQGNQSSPRGFQPVERRQAKPGLTR